MSHLAARPRVHVIDYGMGNLTSVRHALEYLGADVVVSGDPAGLARAAHAILPGVGSFRGTSASNCAIAVPSAAVSAERTAQEAVMARSARGLSCMPAQGMRAMTSATAAVSRLA